MPFMEASGKPRERFSAGISLLGSMRRRLRGGGDASKRYYVVAVRETEKAEETIIGLFWFWGWSKKVPWFGVMIADAYQNRGLGKTMMEYTIAETRQHGKSGILLTTAEHNVRA